MKRLVEFARSVLPADPAQLLLLGGTVCLVIAPRLGWWPAGMLFAPGRTATWVGSNFQLLRVWFVCPIIFASVAGYYVCFWPGKRPVRRMLWVVFSPALIGTGLLVGRVIYLTAPPSSVFASTHWWAQSIPWKSMPGLHFALLGLLLIGLFMSRLALGITSLPLTLPGRVILDGEEVPSWRNLQFVVWFLVGPLFLSSTLVVFLILMLPPAMGGQPWRSLQSPWFTELSGIVDTGLSLGIILFLIGKSERQVLRKWMRLPAGKWAGLALLFPVASATVISAGQYAFDRFEWARQQFGTIEAPDSSRTSTARISGFFFCSSQRCSKKLFSGGCSNRRSSSGMVSIGELRWWGWCGRHFILFLILPSLARTIRRHSKYSRFES